MMFYKFRNCQFWKHYFIKKYYDVFLQVSLKLFKDVFLSVIERIYKRWCFLEASMLGAIVGQHIQ